jgi:hypothetical protein
MHNMKDHFDTWDIYIRSISRDTHLDSHRCAPTMPLSHGPSCSFDPSSTAGF